MNDGGFDLSGEWDGHFDYPLALGPRTPFLATITQQGRHFSGTIIEPDLYGGSTAAKAFIEGVITERAVDFTKTYSRASAAYSELVDYVGQVQGDGDRITGMWSIYEINGTFEMTRLPLATVKEQATISETAPR